MRNIGAFIAALCKKWWALMGCAAFTILSLWIAVGNKSNAWAASGIVILAGVLFLVAAYGAWLEEHKRYLIAENSKEQIEQKYFDERPQLGLRLIAPIGHTAWRSAIYDNPLQESVFFSLHHLNGRIPTAIRFDPIPSLRGGYSLHFLDVPFVKPPVQTPLSFEVWKGGIKPTPQMEDLANPAAKIMEFVWDNPGSLAEFHFNLIARFQDRGEERSQSFPLIFDAAEYKFTRP